MKLITCLFVAALSISPFAQAQVHFASGSAQPDNPGAAMRVVDHHGMVPVRQVVRVNRVRCRDGSVHTVRVCSRHGGIARHR